jgi:hypothetical protein
MSLTIELTPELERKLLDRARSTGTDATQCARQLLENALKSPPLEEVLASFRAQVAASGISEDELDAIVEDARNARARERGASQ